MRRPAPPRIAVTFTLLAAAALLLLVVRLVLLTDPYVRLTRRLHEAVEPGQASGPKLAGGLPAGRLLFSGGAGASARRLRLLEGAAEIKRAFDENPTLANRRALAAAFALRGDAPAALALMSDLAREAPEDPKILNDLAAFYLVDSAQTDRPDHLPVALDLLAQLVDRADAPSESRLNYALSLEALGLTAQASKQWARLGQDRADRASSESGGKTGEASDSRALVRQFEEAVYRALTTKTTPARDREDVSRATRAVSEIRDPAWEAAAQMALDSKEASQPLARGITSYLRGRSHYDADAWVEAGAEFEDASRRLAGAGGPWKLWTDLYGSILDFRKGELHVADSKLAGLVTTASRVGFPTIEGRALWVRALIATQQLRMVEAVNYGERAETLLRGAAAFDDAAQVANLLAETFDIAGDPPSAWRVRQRALRLRPRLATEGRLAIAHVAAQSCRALELWHCAAAFQADNLELEARRPDETAEAYLQAADIERVVRSPDRARGLLQTAKEAAARVSDPLFRERVHADVLEVEAALEEPTRPGRALALAREALALVQRRGATSRSARLHLQAGRASSRLGDSKGAILEFERGVSLLEQLRFDQGDLEPLSAWGQELFRELLTSQMAAGHGDGALLATVSREQSWLHGRRVGETAESELPQILADIPTRVRVLVIAESAKGLVAWVLTSTRLVRLPETNSTDGPAAGLMEALFRAAVAIVGPGQDEWIVVPSPRLEWVDFGAVLGHVIGSSEGIEVVVSPSLDDLTHPPGPSPDHRSLPLVISAPHPPGFAGLAYAAGEAREVASLYPHSTLVEDPQVDVDTFLQLLPGHRIVHFAGHAVTNQVRPGLSHLVVGRTAPVRIESRMIRRAPLSRGSIVVLGACSSAAETASGTGYGLASSFLQAGAAVVVAAPGHVDDYEASRLLTGFHRGLVGGLDPAAALREAKRGRAVESRAGTFRIFGGLQAFVPLRNGD